MSEEERERIKRVYGKSPNIEKTLHDTKQESLNKAKKHPFNAQLLED